MTDIKFRFNQDAFMKIHEQHLDKEFITCFTICTMINSSENIPIYCMFSTKSATSVLMIK